MNIELKEILIKARSETTKPFTGEFEERVAQLIIDACIAECQKVREEEHSDMNPVFLDGISSGAKRCENYIRILFKNDENRTVERLTA